MQFFVALFAFLVLAFSVNLLKQLKKERIPVRVRRRPTQGR